MNETNRNTRTLIVSFVLAIMVLIPLRFVEVGQMIGSTQPQVLGESQVTKEVVTAVPTEVLLEEPYKTIESQPKCVSKAEIEMMADALGAAEMNICK